MKKALIFDLDNTIYPVSSISPYLFTELFELLDRHPEILDEANLAAAKDELQRRHYSLVANKYNFGAKLTQAGLNLLKELEYQQPMQPFDAYHQLKAIPFKKFLVTTGFPKLQWSKVKQLSIEADFDEIHIVDPDLSTRTKKDVFAALLLKYGYKPGDVLAIGDDPESEIKAAADLGIDTFLFDPEGRHSTAIATFRSADLKDVIAFLT